MVDSGEWNALLDGWKYDDIDPLHIDYAAGPDSAARASATGIRGEHSDFSTGFPSVYLKYNGIFHDFSDRSPRTAETFESAIDSVVGH